MVTVLQNVVNKNAQYIIKIQNGVRINIIIIL